MKKCTLTLLLAGVVLFASPPIFAAAASMDFMRGTPEIKSMSVLSFGPEGVLFVGDSRGGAVFAIALEDNTPAEAKEPPQIGGVEDKIAALLGSKAEDVLIHDMAVNPLSKNIYLAVSLNRGSWQSRWQVPNDLGDAKILLRVTPKGEFEEVPLTNVNFARAELPNPIAEDKMHPWKEGTSMRTEAITDLAYADGYLYVAGLSNEEFASSMWRLPYPFTSGATITTLEIFHGAHGKYETNSPIRTFLPYKLKDQQYLLASYLCTPFVTFPVSDLQDGQHVKGRTIGEFGSGNYPLDMVAYNKEGKERLLIANSQLPLMIVNPEDIANYKGSITEEVPGYLGGVHYELRSGAGVQQLDNFNAEFLVALQRSASGKLDLSGYRTARF